MRRRLTFKLYSNQYLNLMHIFPATNILKFHTLRRKMADFVNNVEYIIYHEKVYTTQLQTPSPSSILCHSFRLIYGTDFCGMRGCRIILFDTPDLLTRVARNPYIPISF